MKSPDCNNYVQMMKVFLRYALLFFCSLLFILIMLFTQTEDNMSTYIDDVLVMTVRRQLSRTKPYIYILAVDEVIISLN
jgi:hypothetical protein